MDLIGSIASQAAPFVLAPFIGSFAGSVVRRMPRGRPIVWSRSACENCQRRLPPLEMIPLLSFVVLRGRCRGCGVSFGTFPLIMEVAALGIACAAIAFRTNTVEVWLSCVLGWTLLTIAWIDAEHMRLPDALTLPLLLVGLASAVADPEVLSERAAGAALGYLAFQGVALAYRLLRRRTGLGGGDAKLMAVAGAWLGWQLLPLVVFFAALGGLVWAMWLHLCGQEIGRNTRLPFGPFLALSIWVIWLCSSNMDFASVN